MIGSVAALLFAVIFIALATAGLVLLIRFWAGNLSAKMRIFFAAIAGPTIILGMLVFVSFDGQSSAEAEMVGILLVVTIIIVLIGFPVSLLSTRKLDRMLDAALVPDTSIFE